MNITLDVILAITIPIVFAGLGIFVGLVWALLTNAAKDYAKQRQEHIDAVERVKKNLDSNTKRDA